jgi:spore coat protein U-like protein
MRFMVVRIFVVTFVGLLLASPVQARTCELWQVTGLAFGNYFPMAVGPLDTTSEIRVRCRGRSLPGQQDAYVIRIDGGASTNPQNRYMESGLQQLQYNIYKDAARTSIWGDGTGGPTPLVQPIPGNRNAFNQRHTVYGRIFPLQDPGGGTYSDIVTVTIEF